MQNYGGTQYLIGLNSTRGNKMEKYEYEDFNQQIESEERLEEEIEKVDVGLWHKLEKVGRKISFVKDIKALYSYMKDPYISWHRKTIVVSALLYFILPIDAVPDIAPLIGYLDDLGVITAVIKFLGSELVQYYD